MILNYNYKYTLQNETLIANLFQWLRNDHKVARIIESQNKSKDDSGFASDVLLNKCTSFYCFDNEKDCQAFKEKFRIIHNVVQKQIDGQKYYAVEVGISTRKKIKDEFAQSKQRVDGTMPHQFHEASERLNLLSTIDFLISHFNDAKDIERHKYAFDKAEAHMSSMGLNIQDYWSPYGTMLTREAQIIEQAINAENKHQQASHVTKTSDEEIKDRIRQGSALLRNDIKRGGWFINTGVSAIDLMLLLYIGSNSDTMSFEDIEKVIRVKQSLFNPEQGTFTGLKADANFLWHLKAYHKPDDINDTDMESRYCYKNRRDRLVNDDADLILDGGRRVVVDWTVGDMQLLRVKAEPGDRSFYQSRFIPDSQGKSEIDRVVLAAGGMNGHAMSVILTKEKDASRPGGYRYFYTRCNAGADLEEHNGDMATSIFTTEILPDANTRNAKEYTSAIRDKLKQLIIAERNICFYEKDKKKHKGDHTHSHNQWTYFRDQIQRLRGPKVPERCETTAIQLSGNCTMFSMWLAVVHLLQLEFGKEVGRDMGHDMLQIFKSFQHMVTIKGDLLDAEEEAKKVISELKPEVLPDMLSNIFGMQVQIGRRSEWIAQDKDPNTARVVEDFSEQLTYKFECRNIKEVEQLCTRLCLPPYNQHPGTITVIGNYVYITQVDLELYGEAPPTKSQDRLSDLMINPSLILTHIAPDLSLSATPVWIGDCIESYIINCNDEADLERLNKLLLENGIRKLTKTNSPTEHSIQIGYKDIFTAAEVIGTNLKTKYTITELNTTFNVGRGSFVSKEGKQEAENALCQENVEQVDYGVQLYNTDKKTDGFVIRFLSTLHTRYLSAKSAEALTNKYNTIYLSARNIDINGDQISRIVILGNIHHNTSKSSSHIIQEYAQPINHKEHDPELKDKKYTPYRTVKNKDITVRRQDYVKLERGYNPDTPSDPTHQYVDVELTGFFQRLRSEKEKFRKYDEVIKEADKSGLKGADRLKIRLPNYYEVLTYDQAVEYRESYKTNIDELLASAKIVEKHEDSTTVSITTIKKLLNNPSTRFINCEPFMSTDVLAQISEHNKQPFNRKVYWAFGETAYDFSASNNDATKKRPDQKQVGLQSGLLSRFTYEQANNCALGVVVTSRDISRFKDAFHESLDRIYHKMQTEGAVIIVPYKDGKIDIGTAAATKRGAIAMYNEAQQQIGGNYYLTELTEAFEQMADGTYQYKTQKYKGMNQHNAPATSKHTPQDPRPHAQPKSAASAQDNAPAPVPAAMPNIPTVNKQQAAENAKRESEQREREATNKARQLKAQQAAEQKRIADEQARREADQKRLENLKKVAQDAEAQMQQEDANKTRFNQFLTYGLLGAAAVGLVLLAYYRPSISNLGKFCKWGAEAAKDSHVGPSKGA